MKSIVSINGKDVSIKEYKGLRVVTFKDIDMVHGKAEGAARKRFNENGKRFIPNVDYFEITRADVGDDFGRTYGFDRKAPRGFLLTESGYLMLVKSFTDDLSWTVQRQLVNSYFKCKDILQYPQKSTSVGEGASLIKRIDDIAKAKRCSGTDRAVIANCICEQIGIRLPPCFTEPPSQLHF